MRNNLFSQYQELSLFDFANKLTTNYYEVLYEISVHVKSSCHDLSVKRLPQESMLYIALCTRLANEIEQYIQHRKEILTPYLRELTEKDNTGHNCRNCSGRCDVQHTAKLIDYTVSIEEMKKTLYHIHTVILKEDRVMDDELKALHHLVGRLENILEEVLLLEEKKLLPKIRQIQTKIHATG